MVRISIRKKLLISYLIIGVPLTIVVLFTAFKGEKLKQQDVKQKNEILLTLGIKNLKSKTDALFDLDRQIKNDFLPYNKYFNSSQINKFIDKHQPSNNIDYISKDVFSSKISATQHREDLFMVVASDSKFPIVATKASSYIEDGYFTINISVDDLKEAFALSKNVSPLAFTDSGNQTLLLSFNKEIKIIPTDRLTNPRSKNTSKVHSNNVDYIIETKKYHNSYISLLSPIKTSFLPLTLDISYAYFFASGLLITVILSIISGLLITKPLKQLKKQVISFSSNNYKMLDPIKTGDEFEIIFRKLNQMGGRIKQHVLDIDDKNNELEAIIDNIQSGIFILDSNGKIFKSNKVARDTFGSCVGKNYKNCRYLSSLFTIEGEAISPKDSPIEKLIKGEKISGLILETKRNDTNKRAILNFNGTPLTDKYDNIFGFALIFLDVTKQFRLHERLKRMINYEKTKTNHLSILHKVSLDLNKENNINVLLNIVLEAALDLTDATSGLILQKSLSKPIIASSYNLDLIESYQSHLIKAMSNYFIKSTYDNKISIAFDGFLNSCPKNISDNLKAGIKSLLIIPIEDSRKKIFSLLILLNKEGNKKFSIEDEKITQILASHATVAITNAQNYKKEHNISQVLQRSLLPPKSLTKKISDKANVDLIYKPATNEVLVGGDFYDFITIDENRCAIAIADVNGRGVEAAAITSLVKNTYKAFAFEGLSPEKVLEKANKVLGSQIQDNIFITSVFGLLDFQSGIFEYANAGHPPPMLYRFRKNGILALNEGSTPLGVLENENYDLHRIHLEEKDQLILYTDGLIEGRNNNSFFGENRLIKSILANAPLSVNVADRILEDFEAFTSSNLHDDIAILVLKVKKLAQRQKKIEHLFYKV